VDGSAAILERRVGGAVHRLRFLLIHVADDYRKAYGLVVFMVIVTLARQYCGSVKATIWLHILDNATIVAALLFADTPASLLVHLPPHQPMP